MDVLVLEDDEYTREFIKTLLYELPDVASVKDTSSSDEAISMAKQQNPDLIILDIEIINDDLNGLDVAKEIYGFNQEVYMLFLTAYSQYAISSFVVHPYAYILKPVVIKEFQEIVGEIADKINQKNMQNDHALIINSGNKKEFIDKNEIIFIEVKNKKCIIHSRSGKWSLKQSLTELSRQLNDDFIRVHRSYMVNVKQIQSIRPIWDRTYEIEFRNYSQKAQMSRKQYRKYKKRFI